MKIIKILFAISIFYCFVLCTLPFTGNPKNTDILNITFRSLVITSAYAGLLYVSYISDSNVTKTLFLLASLLILILVLYGTLPIALGYYKSGSILDSVALSFQALNKSGVLKEYYESRTFAFSVLFQLASSITGGGAIIYSALKN